MKKNKAFRPLRTTADRKVFNGDQEKDNLYGHQWEKYRAEFLEQNPFCYMCDSKAMIVDHLRPHKGDFSLFWKEDNYVQMCKSHHDTGTNLFDRNFQKGSSIQSKISWMSWQRAANQITRKVRIVPFSFELWQWINKKRGIL